MKKSLTVIVWRSTPEKGEIMTKSFTQGWGWTIFVIRKPDEFI